MTADGRQRMATSERDEKRGAWTDAREALPRYLMARWISSMGTNMTLVALPLIVFGIHGSAADVGIVSTTALVPYIVLGPIAGVAADRFPRKRLMVASDVVSASVLMSIPLVAACGLRPSLWHLALVAGIVSASTVVFDAANLAAMAVIFPGDRLDRSTGAVFSATTVADIVGPLAGGALVSIADPTIAIAVDASTFIASAVLLASIRKNFEEARGRLQSAGKTLRIIVTDITGALRFILMRREIASITVIAAGVSFTGGAFFGLSAVYAASISSPVGRAATLGVLTSCLSIGGLVSSSVVKPLVAKVPNGRVLTGALILNLTSGAVVLLSLTLSLAAPAMVFYGMSFALVVMNTIIIRQRLTPDPMRGRVMIIGRILASTAARAAGVTVASALVATLSIRGALAVTMLGVAASLVLVLAARVG